MSDLFDAGTPDQDTNPLETLVGPDKKFKTIEDLASGKVASDQFIEQLKGELAGMRNTISELQTELAARKRLEEVVDRIAHRGQESTPPVTSNHSPNTDGEGKAAFDPSKIGELVEQALTKKEQENRAKANVLEVQKTLKETWGDNFANQLLEQANALGMSRQDLNELAARSPQALFRLVGVQKSEQRTDVFSPPASKVNTTGFVPQGSGGKNYSYFSDLRKNDPKTYWTPTVQNEMHRLAKTNPKFYDK